MPTFAYRLLGRVVHSELELPELQLLDDDTRPPEIRIRLGHLQGRSHPEPPDDPPYFVDEAGFLLDKPGVARYGIAGGDTVTVDACAGASPFDIRSFLLGSVFGALAHQRGLLPLHAGSVATGGRAVAMAGRSGTGKSTMTAGLVSRGFSFVSDDISPIDVAAGRPPTVLPGVPRVRLTSETLAALGQQTTGWTRDQELPPKFHCAVPADGLAPATLAAVYMFAVDEDNPEPFAISEVTRGQAVPCIEQLTYMPRYPRAAGFVAEHLHRCVRLAGQVPLFLVHRRRELAELPAFLDRLADHVGTTLAPATQRVGDDGATG